MKKITILGSTGSIGTQSINILSKYPNDFKIIALTGNQNIELLLKQTTEIKPKYVVIFNEIIYKAKKHLFDHLEVTVLSGLSGLIEVATLEDVDVVINSVVGNIGLMPTLKAIQAKKQVAIANKECLVTAGEILMKEASLHQVDILPIDSEHSAIFQALQGNSLKDIKRVILTASGGPFRNTSREAIENMKASDALKHPNWSMGRKISIDSATLMNKGLEVIEAKWLYDLSIDQIDVIVHPQSIIHSMVEYHDHSIIAQMSLPTMEIPILYALSYPERKPMMFETVDFVKLGALTFEAPRRDDFPCLDLAFEAINRGGLVPTVLNAANEELVYAYLKNEISFYDISKYVEKAMNHFDIRQLTSIDDVLVYDQKTRTYIKEILK
ncbi:MAG: 1-deoxy-D-xylulose-5-phosphate reductoisomerase [Clostridiales bacterium]|nr:1-deoxy-D-xylulose-5-phosphate reductoisomerase [Clostridiales bacterium]